MQRGKWIGLGLGAVIAAAGIGGMTVVGCSGDDNSGPKDSGTADHSVPDTGSVGDDSGSDTGSPTPEGGEAGPTIPFAKVYLVHASSVAPPLRFCFGLGDPNNDAGTKISAAPYPAEPDDDTASKAAGLPVPGLYEGIGGPISTFGVDPAGLTLSVYAIDATLLAKDVKSAGTAELTCDKLLGGLGLPGGTTTSGATLKPGQNFWYVGTIPKNTLVDGTSWLAAIVGCVQGGAMTDPRCPQGYDNTTSDLQVKLWPLDSTTKVDGGALGAQFAHASVAWDNIMTGVNHSAGNVFGFVEPPAAVPPMPDAGTDAGDDAGDAGTLPTGPTIVPVTGAAYGDLKPSTLAAIPGLTFDGTSAVFVNALGPDGGGSEVFAPFPFQYVEAFSGLGDAGVIRNGNGYVFVWVGNPTATEYISADGGPLAPDAGGTFNISYPHFLAFPTSNP